MNDQLESFFNLNSKNAVAAPATTFIYGLNCPLTGKCRYVGKADNPHKRFGRHLLRAGESSTHKNCWVRGLAAQGLKPVLEVLDEVPASEWEFWEREYIRVFRMIGFNLTNLTDGGDGGLGLSRPPEVRAKISAGLMGRPVSEETRAKIGAAHFGKKRPLGTGAKISAAKIGRKMSPEACAKMSASRTGKKLSLEHRAKLSASKMGQTGPPRSPETRLKMSAGLKAAWKAGKFSARHPRRNRGA